MTLPRPFRPWILAGLLSLLSLPAGAAHARTIRVSVATGGGQANSSSLDPSISADGRFVAFSSLASNLVHGDTNGYEDVFVRDLKTGRTTRVSVASNGRQGNRGSFAPAISASGRYVAFCSYASNLAGRDRLPRGVFDFQLDPYRDVFVHDRLTGRTRMVSPGSRWTLHDRLRTPRVGSYAPSISDDGRTVAYLADSSRFSRFTNLIHAMVWTAAGGRRQVDTGARGRSGNGDVGSVAASGDGRFVAFVSGSNNLVRGDTNGTWDAFVARLSRRGAQRVSVTASGRQGVGDTLGIDISRDGRFVAFSTYAHLDTRAVDANDDVYVKDRRSGAVTLASVGASGAEANSSPLDFALSPDGRFLAFSTDASNLVPGSTEPVPRVFLRDLRARATVQASGGELPASLGSSQADVSSRGSAIAFMSYATTLVPGDTNGASDVFVATR